MPRRLRIAFPGIFRFQANALAFITAVKDAVLSYAPLTSWIVGTRTFTQGQGQTSDISGTLPGTYTAGGLFDSASGVPLPTGITLSSAGVLADSGASVSTTNGVIFGYNEPGAVPILTLHGTGTNVPYMATAYPAEGAVPSGAILTSPDDTNLRSTVLSAWPDGSAQVVVIAGQTTVSGTKPITLRPAVVSETALTPTYLASLFIANAIQVNFGTLLTLTSTQLQNNYDRIWWQNSQVICARYRLPITNKGDMEAVIDVHAFAGGRAFVEVVIENGKMSSSAPVKPTSQTYTNATVTINGSTVATVSTSNAINATHEAFRAWYCSGWVGGDPGIEVTHDAASMQAHPLFFRVNAASTYNFATQLFGTFTSAGGSGASQAYANDTYSPWCFGRHRYPNMGAGAEHAAIGPIPQWEAHYLQTGDKYCRRAVLASALALNTFSVKYRDSATGLVPTHTAVYGKSTQVSTWPSTGGQFGSVSAGCMEVAHEPSVGLMAFLCRPSPCFIELAQGTAILNATAYSQGTQLFGYYYQTRGKAWCLRNLGQAVFITPDTMPWKAAAQSNIGANITFFRLWDASSEDKLNYLWENTLTGLGAGESAEGNIYFDHSTTGATGFQWAIWMHHWLGTEAHKLHQAKIISGADQTNLSAFVDWALLQPVRWVNEQSNGGWRYIGYRTICGTANTTNDTTIGQLDDWGAMRAWYYPASNPASVSGTWFSHSDNEPATYATWPTVEDGYSGLLYVWAYWNALVCAVDRGVSGAETAWNTVNANVTNLGTFLGSAATLPRNISYPRSK